MLLFLLFLLYANQCDAVPKVTIKEFPSGDALVISGGWHPEFRSDYENGEKPLMSEDPVNIMTGEHLTIQYKGTSRIGTAALKIKHLQFRGTVRPDPSQKAGDTKLLFRTFKKKGEARTTLRTERRHGH